MKREGSPDKMDTLEKILASISETMIPNTYISMMMLAACVGKNTPANNAYTGRRAEHDIKGTSNVVMRRSLGCSMVRAAIIAGTLQPNPMIKGMKLFPFKPTACIRRSISIVTRAIYPESSITEIIRNKIAI